MKNPIFTTPAERPDPVQIVLFGAHSDLAQKFTLPALLDLFVENRLPEQCRIIAVDRFPQSTADYRFRVQQWLRVNGSSSHWTEFAKLLEYVQADITDERGFARVTDEIRKYSAKHHHNVVFYAALPPSVYPALIDNIGRSGIVNRTRQREKGCQRIILEKPFGRDSKSAQALDTHVLSVFPTEWVFRMDHYQGKGIVQFLFSLLRYNVVFDLLRDWSNISHVEIRATEEHSVGERGQFYDANAVFRDMFQNHLLELLILSFLKIPKEITPATIEAAQLEVLRRIRRIDPSEVSKLAVGMQYGRGKLRSGEAVKAYRQTPGVASNSTSPTYGALWLRVRCGRRIEVPVFLESGKALSEKKTEICFHYRCPAWLARTALRKDGISSNRLSITIDPKQEIRLLINGRQDGPENRIREGDFSLDYQGQFGIHQVFKPYELLIERVLDGNCVPFKTGRVLIESWRVLDPVVAYFNAYPRFLPTYAPGIARPAEAEKLYARGLRTFVQ